MHALQHQHTAHALCLVTDTRLLLVHATAHAVSLVTDITLPLVHNNHDTWHLVRVDHTVPAPCLVTGKTVIHVLLRVYRIFF